MLLNGDKKITLNQVTIVKDIKENKEATVNNSLTNTINKETIQNNINNSIPIHTGFNGRLYTNTNILDKNISSYNSTLKSKISNQDNFLRINNLYILEDLICENIEQSRYTQINYSSFVDEIEMKQTTNEYLTEEAKRKLYNGEEDQLYCGRFPHLEYCGCKFPCSVVLPYVKSIKMTENILVGPIEAVFKTKELLKLKVTHILNLSCTEYNRRTKYFKYLDIYINDNHTENAIKFFKISNRFIDDAVASKKIILIHSVNGRSRCWVFLMAYFIGREKMKYLDALDRVRSIFPYAEPNDNFLTQLKHYDLEMNI